MANSETEPRRLPFDCEACRARFDRLCRNCAAEVRQAIARHKSGDRDIRAGAVLFRPGEQCDAVYPLVDGWIFLYGLAKDGRRQILYFGLPEALLGPYPDPIAPYGAEALTDATVAVIPHENLGALFEESPAVGLRLAWIIGRERNLAYDHLSMIGRCSARQRVARLLLELFVRYRMQWPGHRGEEMHLPLTQEHVGDATGLSGIHVNRVLRSMNREGIAELHYRRLRIFNPDKLLKVAGIDSPMFGISGRVRG